MLGSIRANATSLVGICVLQSGVCETTFEKEMIQSFRQSRVLQVLRIASSALRVSDWTLNNVDPDGLKYVARVWVWTHWGVSAACFIALAYRPASGLAPYYETLITF